MRSEKKLLRVLAGATEAPPPVWLMRQAGRYLPEYRAVRAEAGSFLDLCYDPERAAEVTLQPIRRYHFDAAILFSDILVIPHALGRRLWFEEGEGPKLDPLMGGADIDALSDESAMHARLAPVYATLGRVKPLLPADVALIGFAGAPWTVATYMIAGRGKDQQRGAREMMAREPALFARLMARLVDATAAYLIRQIDSGAEVVKIFDSWAGALAADPHAFETWCVEPVREIARRVRAAHPATPVIAFPREAGQLYARFVGDGLFQGLAIDTALDPAWARDHLQPHLAVQGNLDPALVVEGGARMIAAARHLVRTLGGGPFIFNLGHGITPDADPAHVSALVDAVRG
jgi:uroporphyrinogen decarboxylase